MCVWASLWRWVCTTAGVEFEERIKLNEAGNNKFNFLTHTDLVSVVGMVWVSVSEEIKLVVPSLI